MAKWVFWIWVWFYLKSIYFYGFSIFRNHTYPITQFNPFFLGFLGGFDKVFWVDRWDLYVLLQSWYKIFRWLGVCSWFYQWDLYVLLQSCCFYFMQKKKVKGFAPDLTHNILDDAIWISLLRCYSEGWGNGRYHKTYLLTIVAKAKSSGPPCLF